MRLFATLTFVLLYLFPSVVNAAVCDAEGYTVVYTNGVLTDESKARQDNDRFRDKFEQYTGRRDVKFELAHNPSHIAGLGDWIKSVEQAYRGSSDRLVTDYDLETLLRQIHSEVNTQKILLVGHSQGSFYTNALYQYLTTYGGMLPSSVTVYNIAAPASFVAGGGEYLTSSNDKLINQVRELAFAWNAGAPLPANIAIPLTQSEAAKQLGGHGFAEVYLAGAPARIVSAVSSGLTRLGTGTDPEGDGCFILPSESLSYRAKSMAFGLIDPTVATGAQGISLAYQGVARAVDTAARFAETGLVYAETIIREAAKAVAEVMTSPQEQGAAVAQAKPTIPTVQPPVASVPVVSVPKNVLAQPEQPKVLFPVVPPAPSFEPPKVSPQTPKSLWLPITPGFGGGALEERAQVDQEVVVEEESEVIPSPVILTPAEGSVFATMNVTISGTTTPGYTVLLSYVPASSSASTTLSVTPDGSGAWSVALALNEGGVSVAASAAHSGSYSASTSRSFVTDTASPAAPVFSVTECTASLSLSFCLSATTTAHLSWSAIAGATYYALSVDDALVATTTELYASLELVDRLTSSVNVAAYDAAGNSATSTAQNVVVYTHPVSIHEVAWAGTDDSADDEWIELRNHSPYAIDLSRLTLLAVGGGTYIPLSGLLSIPDVAPDSGLLLLERREEATNAAAHLINAFSPLSDTGEELHLEWVSSLGTSTIDQTPAVATCSGWCAGSAASTTAFTVAGATGVKKVSMERVRDSTDGALAASWVSNDTYVRTQATPPEDASGNHIYGTPRQYNSDQLPVAGWYCGSSLASILPDSTYTPSNLTCTYLSSFIDTTVDRYGDLYYGTVGSSTLVSSHVLSTSIKSIQTENPLPAGDFGEPYFIAIYEDRTTPTTDVVNFQDFFTIGSSSPPHSNYRVIPWTYGLPPF